MGTGRAITWKRNGDDNSADDDHGDHDNYNVGDDNNDDDKLGTGSAITKKSNGKHWSHNSKFKEYIYDPNILPKTQILTSSQFKDCGSFMSIWRWRYIIR